MASAFDVSSAEGGFGARLDACVETLATLVAEFEPDRFTGGDAMTVAARFARAERLAATGKALAARRVEDTGAWERTGAASAAAWLARISGQSTGRAAGALGTARRIRKHPDIESAARRGDLSDEQSRAVTGAADKDPAATPALLEKAGDDTVEALRDKAREITLAAQRAEEEQARARRIHASRFLRWWTDEEGAGRLNGRCSPEDLATIEAALRPFQEAAFDAARRAGVRERREALAADALLAMAQAATDRDDTTAGDPSDTGGGSSDAEGNTTDGRGHDARGPGGGCDDGCDDGCDPDCPHRDRPPSGPDSSGGGGPARSGNPAVSDNPVVSGGPVSPNPSRPGNPGRPQDPGRRPDVDGRRSPVPPPATSHRAGARTPARPAATIIVRIDHAALIRGWREAGEVCDIDGVGPVPVTTVHAMMGDAFLAAVVTDGIDIRTVVHLGRHPTAAQITALLARDIECVVPGCHTTRGLEIDHVTGWTVTRTTTVNDLARLCRHHHRQKTYSGATLTGPPGHWRWTPPPCDTPDRSGPGAPPSTPPGASPRGRPGDNPTATPARSQPGHVPRPRPGGSSRNGSDACRAGPTLFDAGAEPFPP